MKLLNVKWFTSGYDVIGIILYENSPGDKRCTIGVGKGVDSNLDIKHIIDWGAKFPVEVAEHFEPGIGINLYEINSCVGYKALTELPRTIFIGPNSGLNEEPGAEKISPGTDQDKK